MTDTYQDLKAVPRSQKWLQLSLRSIMFVVAFAAFLFSTIVLTLNQRNAKRETMFETVAVGDKALVLDLEGGGFFLQVYTAIGEHIRCLELCKN